MWYPPQQQQQQQCWNGGYIHHLSPQKQQQQQQQPYQPTYARTSYFHGNTDESLTTSRATTTTYGVGRNDENESLIHYHSTRIDDVYVAGAEYYVTNGSDSQSYEMPSSSLPYQTSVTHWNPVISAPVKTSIGTNHLHPNDTHPIQPSSSSPSSASACWDWLLYSPEVHSHLYVPSSSFVHQQQQSQDENLDLLASLPSWLLALLYPTMKRLRSADDENESDQEISSLHYENNHRNRVTNKSADEPLLSLNVDRKTNHVSSNLSLSAEPTVNTLKSEQNRSSTPDTDDGYQSASDASRSDYSQQSSVPYDHPSKDDLTVNMPPSLMPQRISYAAAAKPITAVMTVQNHVSPSPTPFLKMKNNSSFLSSNEISNNNNNNNVNGQKSKFIAPRFERMHHAKQYSPPTMMRDSSSSLASSTSSSSSSSTNRTQIRSNHHYNQRHHIVHSSRRR